MLLVAVAVQGGLKILPAVLHHDSRLKDLEFSLLSSNDTTTNGHNVVIGFLPEGQRSTVSAAAVAKDMVRSFPNLRSVLMVGIGGWCANPKA
ncbi:hypothetical protein TWF694_009386 [Orbilia ellipsospora]|uniref:Uncharacterized protein n=1 Tax=Orbilia ellipsospora TaxID=2528407 RepID=A0AAV9XBS6_9PEZI